MDLYAPNWFLYVGSVLDLVFQPDRGATEPLYRQLADYLRALIASTWLREGSGFPRPARSPRLSSAAATPSTRRTSPSSTGACCARAWVRALMSDGERVWRGRLRLEIGNERK